MICVAYAGLDFNALTELLKSQKPELAELRLDSLHLSKDELKKVLSMDYKFIATCKNNDALSMLEFAIEHGASYVDIDVEMEDDQKEQLLNTVKKYKKCKTILSYHDYDKTPVNAELEHIVEWCAESNPDVIKIACTVKEIRDNARLIALLDTHHKMIVLGMGELGRVTRIFATKLGAFCTYASSVKGKETAPGQIPYEDLKKIMEAVSIV